MVEWINMDKKQFDELVVKAAARDAVALWKVGETYRHGNKKLGVAREEKKGWESQWCLPLAVSGRSDEASQIRGDDLNRKKSIRKERGNA